MNVGREREAQGAESDGQGRVPCCSPCCVTKSKVLIGCVGREYDSTDDKGGEPPNGSHLIGRSHPGKCRGCETNGEVKHAGKYHCSDPTLAGKVIHGWAVWLYVSNGRLPRLLLNSSLQGCSGE